MSEPDFRAVFDSLPGLYLLLDREFSIAAVSSGYLDATASSREEIVGRKIFDVFPQDPEDRYATKLRGSLKRVIEERVADTMPVFRNALPSPTASSGDAPARCWRRINAPVVTTAGDVCYIVARVDELSEIPPCAEDREFLGTLAHELRNPLAPLRNGLEVMRLVGNDRSRVEHARVLMERQVRRIARLVDDFLANARAAASGKTHASFAMQREIDTLAAPATSASLVALRVLVVDDNVDAAQSLAILLGIMGHEVQTAHSGVTALAAAQGFRPHVALLDITMPTMDGYELARRMRAAEWGSGILIVAVSGWGEEENRQRSRAAGFDHHLVKPVEPAALRQVLSRAFCARRESFN